MTFRHVYTHKDTIILGLDTANKFKYNSNGGLSKVTSTVQLFDELQIISILGKVKEKDDNKLYILKKIDMGNHKLQKEIIFMKENPWVNMVMSKKSFIILDNCYSTVNEVVMPLVPRKTNPVQTKKKKKDTKKIQSLGDNADDNEYLKITSVSRIEGTSLLILYVRNIITGQSYISLQPDPSMRECTFIGPKRQSAINTIIFPSSQHVLYKMQASSGLKEDMYWLLFRQGAQLEVLDQWFTSDTRIDSVLDVLGQPDSKLVLLIRGKSKAELSVVQFTYDRKSGKIEQKELFDPECQEEYTKRTFKKFNTISRSSTYMKRQFSGGVDFKE